MNEKEGNAASEQGKTESIAKSDDGGAMEGFFLFSLVDAGIFGIKSDAHRVTPMTVKIMPATGRSGIKGQRRMRIRLRMLPNRIIIIPARSKVRREKKPTMRETKRSRNM